MFGVSTGELVIIGLVGLLLFGPEKLPELARSFGGLLAKLNRALESVQQEFNKGMEETKAVESPAESPSADGAAGPIEPAGNSTQHENGNV